MSKSKLIFIISTAVVFILDIAFSVFCALSIMSAIKKLTFNSKLMLILFIIVAIINVVYILYLLSSLIYNLIKNKR